MRMTVTALVALLLCAACATAPSAAPGATGPTIAVEAPTSGKTTVVGRVQDSRTGAPMTNTPVRLAQVYRSEGGGEGGAYVLDGGRSPGAVTNDAGEFVIANIDAHEYVLVVGDLLSDHIVVTGPSGKPKTWNAESGKVLDVGVVSVDLTAPPSGG